MEIHLTSLSNLQFVERRNFFFLFKVPIFRSFFRPKHFAALDAAQFVLR